MMQIPTKDTPDSPAASWAGKPVVDMRRLWNCADEDKQELQRLVGNYLREMEAQLGRMEVALAAGDCAEMTRWAHRSCGASATFGMVAITIPLYALEHLGRAQTLEGAEIHLAQAWRQLELIRDFFQTQPETKG
ncbi:MAG: Hpt domain-containing protein [Verrucomicrobiota bacterium]